MNREENRDGKLLLLFFSKFHYFESTGGRFVPGRVGSLNVSRSRGKDLKISSAHFTRKSAFLEGGMQDPKGASYSSSKFDLNLRYWSSIKGKADEGERRGKVGTKE